MQYISITLVNSGTVIWCHSETGLTQPHLRTDSDIKFSCLVHDLFMFVYVICV